MAASGDEHSGAACPRRGPSFSQETNMLHDFPENDPAFLHCERESLTEPDIQDDEDYPQPRRTLNSTIARMSGDPLTAAGLRDPAEALEHFALVDQPKKRLFSPEYRRLVEIEQVIGPPLLDALTESNRRKGTLANLGAAADAIIDNRALDRVLGDMGVGS
jgi:hypothetical protein